MNLEGLQIFSHEVSGYKPQVDFNTWRVALLNASDMYLPNNITYFDNHLETDEVFILLSGSCALLLAGNDEKPHDTVCHWLEEGKVYNVKSGTWHTLFMMPRAASSQSLKTEIRVLQIHRATISLTKNAQT